MTFAEWNKWVRETRRDIKAKQGMHAAKRIALAKERVRLAERIRRDIENRR